VLNLHAREAVGVVVRPLAALVARTRITPNVVTAVGTTGTVVGALTLLRTGRFFVGVLVVTAFVLTDMLDGALARARGGGSTWGAFLDSTLDRVGDAAIFGALVLWFAGAGDQQVLAGLALYCLASGAVTSYVKARAEGLGLRCDVGFAERAERLILVLVGTGLDGLGVPFVLALALWVLAAATTLTVVQRMVEVRRQLVVAGELAPSALTLARDRARARAGR
jgi:CDP-diacylglycerol---glycerol-3-phosphate 3-phosphatidyltransferase